MESDDSLPHSQEPAENESMPEALCYVSQKEGTNIRNSSPSHLVFMSTTTWGENIEVL